VAGWTDDPELLAIFRAEVDEKLDALREGLLRLEVERSPRELLATLSRDAHTVKGSARALALDPVVRLAHRAEDLLGAIRDGRMRVRRDLVDLLLTTTEGISRAMPGAEHPVSEDDLTVLVAALDAAVAGEDPVEVPRLPDPEAEVDGAGSGRSDSAERHDTVRVPVRRVHDLLDVVGEAELDVRRVERTLARLGDSASDHDRLARSLRSRLVGHERLSVDTQEAVRDLLHVAEQVHVGLRELRERVEDAQSRISRVREGALGLAMVPVRRVVAAFPQLVREVAAATGKEVQLVLDGQDVELDTRVLDAVAEALKHLVTNAVDHGIEPPEERVAAGKPARGCVRVSARAAGSEVVIEVWDDGRGIDEDRLRAAASEAGLLPGGSTLSGAGLHALLFTSGFSTRSEVTETSGRGVGLDVVQTAVERLAGSVRVERQAGGTLFVITLPVTLGVMRCLVARVGDERYALPVANVVETLNLRDSPTHELAGAAVLVRHGVPVPLADLGGAVAAAGAREPRSAVVVRHGGGGELMAWAVDALEGEREMVVKDLGGFLGRMPALNGATIDGDGEVVLLLDVRELAPMPSTRAPTRRAGSPVTGGARNGRPDQAAGESAHRGRPRVLVVEDSVGVRELERVILESAGYDVVTAVDGEDGATRLTGPPVDLVLTDVEMPGMDGFSLTRAVRQTPTWADVPVVIMTSRGDEADKRAGLDAGANAYLLKATFDQAELVDTVRRLVGR